VSSTQHPPDQDLMPDALDDAKDGPTWTLFGFPLHAVTETSNGTGYFMAKIDI
jgi:hypothetical protein